jgi:uncharacterized membrane protein
MENGEAMSREAMRRRGDETAKQSDASSSPRLLASRLWEVDTLRGFAIVEMVIYHFTWDLNYFGLFRANLLEGPWQWFARALPPCFFW